MNARWTWPIVWVLNLVVIWPLGADDAASLRLVPFPKEVKLLEGVSFTLGGKLIIEAPADEADILRELLAAELKRAGMQEPTVRVVNAARPQFRLLRGPNPSAAAAAAFRRDASTEDYALDVGPDAVVGVAPQKGAGLFYAAQTLCQLIRANRHGDALPGLTIRDWPSLQWRAAQDDMTRGPSSRLDTLRHEASLCASLKLNLFTYYMEYQYAFSKHPEIGPKDGSLTPGELTALVAYGQPRHVEILGNQQSFGHFGHILKHPRYAGLQETPDVLCPTNEQSYQLLDDMYSEVCPLLPLPFFNVCCDETWGLGKGPSKQLAEKIGVGGVYVQHIQRVHDLLAKKYHKRMMMWGDIILQHPEHLKEIPKDTIMLTWGYDARTSFEDQIVPFARSGFEFFVCPGCSNWSRILPDFDTATVNIRNFVRDGCKHGTIGMINTDWQDDGEALKSVKWHADAWAAECAWNAAMTAPESFNRRIGAVLFGERGDHFGQAIALLAQTHKLPGMKGMLNARFWHNDFPPPAGSATKATAGRLVALTGPAIEHLEACKREATANAELLDAFLLGARRMEAIGQRMLDGLEAYELYEKASEAAPAEAVTLLTRIEATVRKHRESYESLGRQFSEIWLRESKPFALDLTMKRYAAAVKRCDDLARGLAEAKKEAAAGRPLPEPEQIGFAVPESLGRKTRPSRTSAAPLAPNAPWLEPAATHRLGVLVRAGSAARFELPVEIDVTVPSDLASKPITAYCSIRGSMPHRVPVQLDPLAKPRGQGKASSASPDRASRMRLVFLISDPIPRGSEAVVHVYLGLPRVTLLPSSARTADAPAGMKTIENDKVRLLLGPEGGHVFRWEIRALSDRDMTEPGVTGWSGFSDLGGEHRSAQNSLICLARGPAMVRYRCVEPSGLGKTITLFGGVSWMEVVLDDPASYYWDFDDTKNFASDGPTPGKYLFSNGTTGPVGARADGVRAQVEASGVFWSIKFNPQYLALGLVTPDAATRHHLAPGGGAGGVGASPAGHVVTYAGLLQGAPAEAMDDLQKTLSFRNPPEVVLHPIEPRGEKKLPSR